MTEILADAIGLTTAYDKFIRSCPLLAYSVEKLCFQSPQGETLPLTYHLLPEIA
jgi:hypothetical protein